jgi:hypothetical protein
MWGHECPLSGAGGTFRKWPIAPDQHNAANLSDANLANFAADGFPALESISATNNSQSISKAQRLMAVVQFVAGAITPVRRSYTYDYERQILTIRAGDIFGLGGTL